MTKKKYNPTFAEKLLFLISIPIFFIATTVGFLVQAAVTSFKAGAFSADKMIGEPWERND